jgi:hypothetical protein
MKLIATYAWSATFEVDVPDTATLNEQRNALDTAIANAIESGDVDLSHPILTECSNPDLID